MPRRKVLTEEDQDRALRRGFGIGEKESYKPWIRVQDVPSKGRSTKLPGLLINRPHHLLSDLETSFHHRVERDTAVVDIREQFPILPVDLTIAIAEEASISHPRVPKTRTPSILTIDSLVTRKIGDTERYWAYSCKYATELRNRRAMEKLDLERLACAALGIPWRLVLDTQMDVNVTANLKWASKPLRGTAKEDVAPFLTTDVASAVLQTSASLVRPLELLISCLSSDFCIDRDLALEVVRALVWEKFLDVDLSAPIQASGVVTLLSVDPPTEAGGRIFDAAG